MCPRLSNYIYHKGEREIHQMQVLEENRKTTKKGKVAGWRRTVALIPPWIYKLQKSAQAQCHQSGAKDPTFAFLCKKNKTQKHKHQKQEQTKNVTQFQNYLSV